MLPSVVASRTPSQGSAGWGAWKNCFEELVLIIILNLIPTTTTLIVYLKLNDLDEIFNISVGIIVGILLSPLHVRDLSIITPFIS